jgi:hypothetical protein
VDLELEADDDKLLLPDVLADDERDDEAEMDVD